MKQLKVIVPSYSTANGIFRASFKDSVTIDPNSKVVFDKIAFTVTQGNNTNISLPASTIQINTAANLPASQNRNVFLAGANYATSTELCRALNEKFNGCLNSDPLLELNDYTAPDLGLAFYNTAPDNIYKFTFNQVQNSYVDIPTIVGVRETQAIETVPVFTPYDNVPSFIIADPEPLLMGALSASTSIINFNNITSNNLIFQLGLYDENADLQFGIDWNGGIMSKIEGGNVTGVIPNESLFNNTVNSGLRCYFFVKDGLLHFTLADMSDVDPVNWQYLIQPIAFIGYDVNTVYSFAVKGSVVGTTTVGFTNFLTTNDEVLTPNTAGTAYYLDTDKIKPLIFTKRPALGAIPYSYGWLPPPTPNIFERSVRLNFTEANALWYGLNLGTSIVQTPLSTSGIINGLLPIGFIANQEYELDILDFPLESYVSNPAKNSGRVNGVVFFTPILLNPGVVGSSNFAYDTRNYFPISIKNEFPMVIESLNFRLFSPSQPAVPINFEGITFNLYIQGNEDN